MSSPLPPATRWHGTYGRYNNHGCRCAACRAANANYKRAYLKARRRAGICQECNRKAAPYSRCGFHRAVHAADAARMRARRKLKEGR